MLGHLVSIRSGEFGLAATVAPPRLTLWRRLLYAVLGW